MHVNPNQMTTSTALINIQDAVVTRGQAAWGKIKATAAEQRELWRQVGEALLVGRKANPSNQGFGTWLKDHGFDDISSQYRSAAMFVAREWPSVSRITGNVSDPIQIQKDFTENRQTSTLPEELKEVQVEQEDTLKLDQRSAEKIAKTINRAKSGDEGSEIAQRHVEALAKKRQAAVGY